MKNIFENNNRIENDNIILSLLLFLFTEYVYVSSIFFGSSAKKETFSLKNKLYIQIDFGFSMSGSGSPDLLKKTDDGYK